MTTLTAPNMIEALDFESIYQSILAQFCAILPEYDTLLESDPAIKLLQVAAYRELLLRERINIVARSSLLAFAAGSDLEHIGFPFGVTRLENETDEQLRTRTAQALEGITTAGSIESYQYHAGSAHGDISDVRVTSPSKGNVLVSLLEKTDADINDIISAVTEKLNEQKIRPITDTVTVTQAENVQYQISVVVFTDSQVQALNTITLATASLNQFISDKRKIGQSIRLSAIDAASHVEGVSYVNIISPTEDIIINETQSAENTAIIVEFGGVE